jgi:hypothetical protein
MLREAFRQSDEDWDPAEALAQIEAISADPNFWAEVEQDLAEHPDIWSLPDYETMP